MANLKEVRNRIVSVSSTQQITKAMKMVSAAKLKKAQDSITQMRPYANKLKEILENLSASLDTTENAFARTTKGKNVLIIPIASNRGLAGAFNANVIKKTWSVIRENYSDCNVSVLCIGKKVDDAFRKTEYHIVGTDLPHHLNELFDKLTFDNVAPVAEKIMNVFVKDQFDKIFLVYNQFKNAASQITIEEQFLPIIPTKAEGKSNTGDYIFEPSKKEIVDDLIPKSLKIQLYKALLDSFASEHGARMTAMHKATDNAGTLIKDLKLSYNKARQAAITNEILEIVGGAEALKS